MMLLTVFLFCLCALNVWGLNKSSLNKFPVNFKQKIVEKLINYGGALAAIGASALASPVAAVAGSSKYPLYGDESLMGQKEHGTSNAPVQTNLRYNCDVKLADRICNYNRRWAEFAGYFLSTSFLKDVSADSGEITFYDSVTGKPLFKAPRGRSFQDFVDESKIHGWPSFRDDEVVWENVRCLRDGETVSLTGTHLGHNLPDRKGNRYCINLVSIAGNPA